MISGAFDRFYWMVAHLTVLAEILGFAEQSGEHSDAVLFYMQGKDSRYLTPPFSLYLPLNSAFAAQFPGVAAAEESVINETDFVGQFSVPDGTPVGTSHLAVTARGYLRYGRPSPSSRHMAQLSDLGGWALDLATLWIEFNGDPTVSHPATYADTKTWFEARLGIRDSSLAQGAFSFDDLVGDIDGYLIGSLANDDLVRPLDDVVREIRVGIAASATWRYEEFYSQRFGSSWTTARSAAVDVFTSGNFLVSSAVSYFFGGIEFVISAPYGGSSAVTPTTAEITAMSEVWANLLVALATVGATAAPSP